MNLIGGQALMYLAGPLISKILEEMAYTIVSDENLLKLKIQMITTVREATQKNSWKWDDDLVEELIELMNNGEFFSKWGDKILEPIELWIVSNQTKWDDIILLPVIKLLRSGVHLLDAAHVD